QYEHCARAARKVNERCIKIDACLDLSVRAVRAKRRVVTFDQTRRVTLRRPNALEHDVDAEPVQPGAERALSAEAREAFPGPNENVLPEVARFPFIAGHAPAQRVD